MMFGGSSKIQGVAKVFEYKIDIKKNKKYKNFVVFSFLIFLLKDSVINFQF